VGLPYAEESKVGSCRKHGIITYKIQNKGKTKEGFLIREAKGFYNRLNAAQYLE
jgi:hypothetical protein